MTRIAFGVIVWLGSIISQVLFMGWHSGAWSAPTMTMALTAAIGTLILMVNLPQSAEGPRDARAPQRAG